MNRYLLAMEKLFWPDLFIIGGGISKVHEKFIPLLTVQAKVVPAQLQNEAGIVGAALFARDHNKKGRAKKAGSSIGV